MADRELLERELLRLGRVVVALSGGIDSLTLSSCAWGLRGRGLAVDLCFADGAAVPRAARERVHTVAAERGWAVRVVDAGEVQDPAYASNPVDRCYHCKSHLFVAVGAAFPDGAICTGANLDDVGDYRPGRVAAKERGVHEPFITAGYTKADVRALARDLGLGALSELPASPCLSSRVETGVAIDPALLGLIDAVEGRVRALGAAVVRCRVRHDKVVIEHDGVVGDHDVIAAASPVLIDHDIALPLRTAAYAMGSAFLRVLP